MKTLRYILLIGWMLSSFMLVSQVEYSVKLVEGKTHKKPGKLIKILGESNAVSYSLFHDNGNYFIVSYDQQMNKQQRYKINLKEKSKLLQLHAVVLFGDELFIFKTFDNRKRKAIYTFVQKVEVSSLKKISSSKVISENFYAMNKSYLDLFIRTSDNQKYMVLAQRIMHRDRLGDILYTRLFDWDFNLIESHNLKIGLSESDPVVWDIDIENNGTYSIVAGHSLHRKKMGESQQRSVAYLYKCTLDSVYSYELDLQNRKVLDASIDPSEDGAMVSFVTSEHNKNTDDLSLLLFSYTPELQVKYQSHNYISMDSLLRSAHLIGNGKKRANPKDMEVDYPIVSLKKITEKEWSLTIEQKVVTSTSDHPDVSDFYSVDYEYKNVINLRFNQECELLRTGFYPKCQSGNSNYYLSLLVGDSEKASYFIYNDGVKSLGPQKKKQKCFELHHKPIIILGIASEKGIEKYSLLGAKSIGWMVVATRSHYDKKNKVMLLYLQKRKQSKMVRLSIIH